VRRSVDRSPSRRTVDLLLEREMELARRVQRALVPSSPPAIPGLESAGWTRSASVTAGDCFDLWRLKDGGLGVLVGDASGHGLAAALVITQVRAMLRALCESEGDPCRMLAWVNGRLAQDLVEGRFVTAFLAFLSPDGQLRWASAGQGSILFRAAADARFEPLQAPAVPLGLAEELVSDPAPELKLDPGGMVAAMTDGVFEAKSPAGELLGPDRVARILDQHAGLDLPDVMVKLQAAIGAWQHGDHPDDDQTIVLVRRAV